MTDERRLAFLKEGYFPLLARLRELWEQKGEAPDFYQCWYLPLARELTGPGLGA